MKDNRELIELIVGLNPREVKRFINSFVIVLDANPGIKPINFLVHEALRKKWYNVYEYILESSSKSLFKNFLEKSHEDREKLMSEAYERKEKDVELNDHEKILIAIKSDDKLYDFIAKYKKTILELEEEDAEKYHEAAESVELPMTTLDFYKELLAHLSMMHSIYLDQHVKKENLTDLLKTKGRDIRKYLTRDRMFEDLYKDMDDKEKSIFLAIRALTKEMKKENASMLKLLNKNNKFFNDLPRLKDLRHHLDLWLAKYNSKINQEQTALIYVAVEEGGKISFAVEYQQYQHWP